MLQKRIELEKKDLIILLSWLQSDLISKNKNFNYEELLKRCILDDNLIKVEDYFDNLMFDLYSLYEKLSKTTKEQIERKLIDSQMGKIIPKKIIEESIKELQIFLNLYEELMLSSKFEDPKIKTIQKDIINNLITKYIATEEYEKCILLKEKIKEI